MARQPKTDLLEISAPAATGKSLYERVAGYLDANDWSYSAHEEQAYFSMNCRLKDGAVRVVVDVYEQDNWESVIVFSVLPVFVPENRRPAIAEAICRINYTHRFGNLEMDMNDGEIRVRTVIESQGGFDDPMIERVLGGSLNLANRYMAPLLAIAFGGGSPAMVLEMVAKNDDQPVQ